MSAALLRGAAGAGLGVCLCAIVLSACAQAPARTRLNGKTMGTTWSVTLSGKSAGEGERLRAGIERELDRVVAQMSTFERDSDLSRYNRAAAGTWQDLPEEFANVLGAALAQARDSGGAFDPTVGPLVELWGFGPGKTVHEVPSVQAIETARARIGWQRVEFDPQRRRVLQPGGVHLDLSAIAKGYGVDQVARYLLSEGRADFLVEVGGELRAHGERAPGEHWQVAIENPHASDEAVSSEQPYWRRLALVDQAVATSGDYRHTFEHAGRMYSHHIDPRSGWPVEHRIAQVTTIADGCMQADSMGTTIMVLGPEAGLAYAQRHDMAVLLLVHEGDHLVERMSPAFAALLARQGAVPPR